MSTARSLTVSRSICQGGPPLPCTPPTYCHACPLQCTPLHHAYPLPCTPPTYCHACPLQCTPLHHAYPLPCTPPPPCMPPLPCMPPCHTCPPATHGPLPHATTMHAPSPRSPTPWTEFLTRFWKYYLAQTSLRAVTRMHSSRMHTACLLTDWEVPSLYLLFMALPFHIPPFMVPSLSWQPLTRTPPAKEDTPC